MRRERRLPETGEIELEGGIAAQAEHCPGHFGLELPQIGRCQPASGLNQGQGGREIALCEARHHDALKAVQAGVTVLAVLHSNSERIVLKSLKTKLEKQLSALQVFLSKSDRDPFRIC